MLEHTLRRTIIMLAFSALCVACAAPPRPTGPGMIVSFRSVIKGKSVDVRTAVSSNKKYFAAPGELGPDPSPTRGGFTMGAAPDGRDLPEWVEFTWKEWPYPYPDEPSDPVGKKAWSDQVHATSRSLPIHTARVAVRNRVPQDVVDEVVESARRRAPKALPEKMLWVDFVWYDSGIRFHWSLEKGCCEVLRAGGDDLEN